MKIRSTQSHFEWPPCRVVGSVSQLLYLPQPASHFKFLVHHFCRIGVRSMRIGIVPAFPSQGGVYQYSLSMLRALSEWKDQGCEDEFVVFAEEAFRPALQVLSNGDGRLKAVAPQPPSLRKKALNTLRTIIGEGPHREAWRWLRRQFERAIDQRNP